MNATAHVTPRGAELWVPTQYQSMVREVVAELLGLPREKVTVHTTVVGGGFGRRTEIDYAIQAVKIARHVEQPVKLVWSREEDISRGYFRPMAVMQLTAALDEHGQPTAFSFTAVVAQVVELEVSPIRAVRLHRIYCVVDCGIAFNPDAVVAQMEGGIIFGLTGALLGEISLKDGAVLQKNFDSYPLLTLAQTPKIEVAILQSDAPVGGVGEEAVPPVGLRWPTRFFPRPECDFAHCP